MNSPARAAALEALGASPESPGRSTIDFYDRNASTYAQSTRALSLQAEIDRFASLVPSDARILDVGCGGGRDLSALRQAGLCPHGLELSVKLAAIARRYSGCPVVIGDMRDPPFADTSFDGLWAAASLLHLDRDEMLPTLRRLRRLLEPGGLFFASLKLGLGSEHSPDGRQFTYFTTEEWSALLNSAGFTDIQIDSPVVDGRRPGSPAVAWLQSLSRAD